jgi:hypothetical protein
VSDLLLCNEWRRLHGETVLPRTCLKCGLGPCHSGNPIPPGIAPLTPADPTAAFLHDIAVAIRDLAAAVREPREGGACFSCKSNDPDPVASEPENFNPDDLPSVPGWMCWCCGKQVGYLGNWAAKLFGTQIHGCTFKRWTDAGYVRAKDREPCPPASRHSASPGPVKAQDTGIDRPKPEAIRRAS